MQDNYEQGEYMKFGEKIKVLRVSKGWTQDELAKKSNLTLRTIINYETGASYPKKTRSLYFFP